MKIWSSEHVFNHSWDNVVKAALQKYPNPLNPSVIGVDVIDRHVDDNGRLRSHRLFATQWNLSPWVAKLIGGNKTCFGSEHSVIDNKNKSFSLWSRNLTLNNLINVDEKLTYSIHPEDKNKTLLKQEAQITVQNLPIIDYMEGLVLSRINTNAHKGRQAIEYIIHKMNNITDDKAKVTEYV